ncbi:NUDIX domain-containing protein [Streptomyces sp. NPDC005438]|uniref:NUDIX hydrolase n=1 Tax=Streptomyces sp. NPDC005438 TaxID=3156880 RepID=UPI0033A091BF
MLIDTVAWVLTENGAVLCVRPTGRREFFVPGGKREGAETDRETLLREIHEELTLTLDPTTLRHLATYQAPVSGQDSTPVRMSCYRAHHHGTPRPSQEIAELDWLTYRDRDRVPPVDQLLFDDLRADGHLR